MSFIFLLTLGIACTALYIMFLLKKKRTCSQQPIYKSPPYFPHNTIIVFDIHGVLFKHNYKGMLKEILTFRFMYALFPCLVRPKIFIACMKLFFSKAVPEAYIVGLSKQFPCLRSFSEIGIGIANLQIPHTSVWKLVRTLHSQGYELHILSNIGETIFKDLQKKHPDIFALFTAVKVASPAEEYKGKPHPHIFDTYLATYNPTGKLIIFIDDKQKNIQAAADKGMNGIFFCCSGHLQAHLNTLSS